MNRPWEMDSWVGDFSRNGLILWVHVQIVRYSRLAFDKNKLMASGILWYIPGLPKSLKM